MLPPAQTTVKIIRNPRAGNAKTVAQKTVEQVLTRNGVSFSWVTLADLRALAKNPGQHHTVLVMGGDGTLHEVLNTVGAKRLSRFTFGIIPTGTGNDFARSLGIPLRVDQALHLFLNGYHTAVDLGVVNGNICCTCALSLGFGPEVSRYATSWLKALLGRGALFIGGMMYFFKPKPLFELKVRINQGHKKRLRTPHMVIGNARTHGGGYPISPTAGLQSRKLDLYYVKPLKPWQISKLLYRAFISRNQKMFEEVTYHQVEEIEMSLPQPIHVDIDGDLYRFYRKIHIRVHPGRIRVVVPRPLALDTEPSLQHKRIQHPPRQLVSRDNAAV